MSITFSHREVGSINNHFSLSLSLFSHGLRKGHKEKGGRCFLFSSSLLLLVYSWNSNIVQATIQNITAVKKTRSSRGQFIINRHSEREDSRGIYDDVNFSSRAIHSRISQGLFVKAAIYDCQKREETNESIIRAGLKYMLRIIGP